MLHGDGFVQCDKDRFERCRFFQVFVRAKAEGQLLIARRVVGGSVNDNWHVAQALVRTDFVAQPVAVHTWHQDVRQHGLHLFASKDLQGFDAIGGFEHGVARGLEPLAQELSIRGDVVYDNEFHKTPDTCFQLPASRLSASSESLPIARESRDHGLTAAKARGASGLGYLSVASRLRLPSAYRFHGEGGERGNTDLAGARLRSLGVIVTISGLG